MLKGGPTLETKDPAQPRRVQSPGSGRRPLGTEAAERRAPVSHDRRTPPAVCPGVRLAGHFRVTESIFQRSSTRKVLTRLKQQQFPQVKQS